MNQPPSLPEGTPQRYRDFEPCERGRACLAHITHPCDNCGRIAGRYPSVAAPRVVETTNYVQEIPGTRVPFPDGEPFQLYPSNRPESITLDIDTHGVVTIAEDATVDELRVALTMVARAFNRLRRLADDLECRPLVLLAKREALIETLVEAQMCDRAEAERRATRRYPAVTPPRPSPEIITGDTDAPDHTRPARAVPRGR